MPEHHSVGPEIEREIEVKDNFEKVMVVCGVHMVWAWSVPWSVLSLCSSSEIRKKRDVSLPCNFCLMSSGCSLMTCIIRCFTVSCFQARLWFQTGHTVKKHRKAHSSTGNEKGVSCQLWAGLPALKKTCICTQTSVWKLYDLLEKPGVCSHRKLWSCVH